MKEKISQVIVVEGRDDTAVMWWTLLQGFVA